MKDKYVEGAWTCPNCGTENRGSVKLCRSCGVDQPPDVSFFIPSGPLKYVTAPEQLAEASNGPDVHCPFCNTRNANGRTTCSQCGGDLDGGKVRKVGDNPYTKEDEGVEQPVYQKGFKEEQLSGLTDIPEYDGCEERTYDPMPVSYHLPLQPSRSSLMSSQTKRLLQNIGWAVLGVAVTAIIIFAIWNTFFNVKPENVQIVSFGWQLSVPIGEIRTYHENDKDSTEPGAYNISSRQVETGTYEKKTVEEDVLVTKEDASHCGTHMADQGNGYFKEVANSCSFYEKQSKQVDDLSKPIKKTVYDYDVDRWTNTRTVISSGEDNNPVWPKVVLAFGESEGIRTQHFTVRYTDAESKPHSYTTSDWNWFVVRRIGETCSANRNGWGTLNSGITCPAQ